MTLSFRLMYLLTKIDIPAKFQRNRSKFFFLPPSFSLSYPMTLYRGIFISILEKMCGKAKISPVTGKALSKIGGP